MRGVVPRRGVTTGVPRTWSCPKHHAFAVSAPIIKDRTPTVTCHATLLSSCHMNCLPPHA